MSLSQPTEQEAEAMVRLNELSEEFRVFLRMLVADAESLNERLINAPDLSEREEKILIGQLRYAARLTDAVTKSKHTLQRHRGPKS